MNVEEMDMRQLVEELEKESHCLTCLTEILQAGSGGATVSVEAVFGVLNPISERLDALRIQMWADIQKDGML
jgi:hypothetical protein